MVVILPIHEFNVHSQSSTAYLAFRKAVGRATRLEAAWCNTLAWEKALVENEVVTETFPGCVSDISSSLCT